MRAWVCKQTMPGSCIVTEWLGDGTPAGYAVRASSTAQRAGRMWHQPTKRNRTTCLHPSSQASQVPNSSPIKVGSVGLPLSHSYLCIAESACMHQPCSLYLVHVREVIHHERHTSAKCPSCREEPRNWAALSQHQSIGQPCHSTDQLGSPVTAPIS